MGIQIDKVPLPTVTKGRASPYPWRHLRIGDSFFVPRTVCLPVGEWQKACGSHFTTRTVTENGVQGTRCWRIA